MENNIINRSVKELFNIDSDFLVPCFEKPSIHTPKIDESYYFNKEITLAIASGFKYNKRVMIHGFHGTGKSTHIEQVAARLNWPTVRVNLDGYISRIELVGRDAIIVKDGKQVTEFRDGLIPWSIKQPMCLILDEYDAARPDVMFAIQRLLEGDGKFTLVEQNMVIDADPNFRIFATSNTLGQGDPTGMYHGTQYINQGQMDRWNIVARLNYLTPDEESKIIFAKFPKVDKTMVKDMIALANLTRQGFLNGDISNLMSPRTIINWVDNFNIFKDLELAFGYSFLNKCDEVERLVIAEFYQRIFGSELAESAEKVIIS